MLKVVGYLICDDAYNRDEDGNVIMKNPSPSILGKKFPLKTSVNISILLDSLNLSELNPQDVSMCIYDEDDLIHDGGHLPEADELIVLPIGANFNFKDIIFKTSGYYTLKVFYKKEVINEFTILVKEAL